MKACDLNRILQQPIKRSSRFFERHVRALMRNKGDLLTLPRIMLFEMTVEVVACLISCVVNMEKHFSNLKVFCQ